jgi:hypothetical protein
MKLRTIAVLAFIISAALLWSVKHHRHNEHSKQRETQYQATLVSYASEFKPGITRAQAQDLLHTKNVSIEHAQQGDSSWDDFIKIGVEYSGLCNRDDIDIRLHFTPSGATPQAPSPPDDKLLDVTLFRFPRGCF